MLIIHRINSNISLSFLFCTRNSVLMFIRCRELWNSIQHTHTAVEHGLSSVWMCVCVVNVSNQIFRYDSKSCKLLVHGINKMPPVREKECQHDRTIPRQKRSNSNQIDEPSTEWNKTVDDALNKLLKLTEN